MNIYELREMCDKKISEGEGKREIVLCIGEDEFYPLHTGFSPVEANSSKVYDCLHDIEMDEENAIVLN